MVQLTFWKACPWSPAKSMKFFQIFQFFLLLATMHDLPGNYILPKNSDWYKTVLSYWAPLILCTKCPDDVQKPTTMEALNETFLNGGYYNVSIVGKIISIKITEKCIGLESVCYWLYLINYDFTEQHKLLVESDEYFHFDPFLKLKGLPNFLLKDLETILWHSK